MRRASPWRLRSSRRGGRGCGCSSLAAGSAVGASSDDVGWGGFGNTPDELRHSPLTQIDAGQRRASSGGVFTVDFRQIDAGVQTGQQSYPVEANGTLYVTTNDDNVWALDATTGKVKWRWTPTTSPSSGTSASSRTAASRSATGTLFVLTLDMTIVSLDPATGKLLEQVPIAKAVPGASSNYGYSETSAPICADHRLIVGAAGSEYGVRGFVMAYHTDLTPAWPNPVLDDPAGRHEWRRLGTLVGGGVVWTPTDGRHDDEHALLRHRLGDAALLPVDPARRSNPRADSLIAVDLATGRMKWWQQQMASQRVVVRHRAAAARLRRRRSAARRGGSSPSGRWRASGSRTTPQRAADLPADQGDRPDRAPGAASRGSPSRSSRRRSAASTISPASYDPKTNYIFNAAAETAALDDAERS